MLVDVQKIKPWGNNRPLDSANVTQLKRKANEEKMLLPLQSTGSFSLTRKDIKRAFGNVSGLPGLETLIRAGPENPLELTTPGVFFGGLSKVQRKTYFGMRQGEDGNILVVGGTGAGKTSGVFLPTLRTWSTGGGSLFAVDIKGDLFTSYKHFRPVALRQGIYLKPGLVIDPLQPDSPSYDPFGCISSGDTLGALHCILDIALALFPVLPGDNQPFWVETERGVCAAGLLHYWMCGLSFSEAITLIATSKTSELLRELEANGDALIQMMVGEGSQMRGETLASVDCGLRNHIRPLALDRHLMHLFRGSREGAKCVSWQDLDDFFLFLRVPQTWIEQWGAGGDSDADPADSPL